MPLVLPKLIIDDTGAVDLEDMLHALGEGDEWIAIGTEDPDGFGESIAYCHPINAPLIVAACNQHADLLVLRDEVTKLLTSPYRTEGDRRTLNEAYAKVKP